MTLSRNFLIVLASLMLCQLLVCWQVYDAYQKIAAINAEIERSVMLDIKVSRIFQMSGKITNILVKVQYQDPIVIPTFLSARQEIDEILAVESNYTSAREIKALALLRELRLVLVDAMNLFEQGKLAQQKGELDFVRAKLRVPLLHTYASFAHLASARCDLMHEQNLQIIDDLEKERQTGALVWLILGLAAVGEPLLILSFWFVVRSNISRRMERLDENVRRFRQQKSLLDPEKGEDEIAQLDYVFHRVVDVLREEQYNQQSLLDNQNDIFCLLNSDLHISQINQASSTVLGYPPDDLLGTKLELLVDPEERASLAEHFQAAHKSDIHTFPLLLIRSDQRHIHTSWLVWWSGQEDSFFCAVQDITEKVRTEQLKQDVLQMVNHDLKTPLMTVSSFLQMFETPMMGEVNERGKAETLLAYNATDKMLQLIKNLLDVEKYRAGMLQMQRELHSLLKIVDEVIEKIEAASPVPVVIETEIADGPVYADRERLAQVIDTLINKAIESSREGGRLLLRSGETEGRSVISVEYQGEPFMPVGLSTAGDEEGLVDSSLALCRAIVELHRGALFSEERNGKCVVRLTLPVAAN